MDRAPGKDELLFLPLGGSGEIGMNLNLYGHAGKWLMIDLGISFGDDSTPGIDVVLPDPDFIANRRTAPAGALPFVAPGGPAGGGRGVAGGFQAPAVLRRPSDDGRARPCAPAPARPRVGLTAAGGGPPARLGRP